MWSSVGPFALPYLRSFLFPPRGLYHFLLPPLFFFFYFFLFLLVRSGRVDGTGRDQGTSGGSMVVRGAPAFPLDPIPFPSASPPRRPAGSGRRALSSPPFSFLFPGDGTAENRSKNERGRCATPFGSSFFPSFPFPRPKEARRHK